MNKATVYSLTLLLALTSLIAMSADNFNVYLVRHAEKQKEGSDPRLTRCGSYRAKQLADMLRNVELAAVYSTSYNRTMETATPTAQSKSIAIKQYAPGGLSQLARVIKQHRKDVLVVGHSNTTPQLISLLSDNDSNKINEDEYQHLFQIQFHQNTATLVKLTQPLDCTGINN